jgi:hypothetical protein
VDRLASAISREIRWRVIKIQLTKQQFYILYVMYVPTTTSTARRTVWKLGYIGN